MKKATIPFAAAMLVGGAAQAQSNVTLYGIFDLGVESITHSSKGSLRVNSGGMNTSRWGFRGSEDLGGGLKAVFNLEGGVQLDTGELDGALFKRQATLGLEGDFGRVVLGRSFTTVYDFVLPFDPLAYAPYYSWATSGNASGASKYGMATAFDNLVKYSGKVGDVRFGASYGFGEQPASTADSAKLSTAVSYLAGPLGLVATYEKVNGNTLPATGRRDQTSAYHLGVMYSVGDFKGQLAARDYQQVLAKAGAPDLRATLYWGGLSYQAGRATTLTGAVYYQAVRNVPSDRAADPVMYVARARYALSKRTDLYVVAARAKAKNHQLVGLSRDDPGLSDRQRGLMAGIQHRF